MTSLILGLALFVVLVAFFGTILLKKYRAYLQIQVTIATVLFAAFLIVDSLIYLRFIYEMNNPTPGHLFLDMDPFPDMVLVTLNWHIPCMAAVVVAILIMIRKTNKNVHLWICLGVVVLSILGFVALAHHLWTNCLDGNIGEYIWWL